MWKMARIIVAAGLLALIPPLAGQARVAADVVVNGSFDGTGSLGFAGSPPSLSINFGGDGQGTIFQMDGFVNYDGLAQSRELSNGTPAGIVFTFSASQPTAHQLLLDYQFTNNTGADLTHFQFLHFVDPDIGPVFNDEAATVAHSLGTGHVGSGPTSYEVGDPAQSTLFTDLLGGTLSNGNYNPPGTPGDVAIGLGFAVGTVDRGRTADFRVLLSDDGTALGGLSIAQNDPFYTSDSLTVSGLIASVPEPSSWLLLGAGIGALAAAGRARRGRG